MVNALSIDLEDWFCAYNLSSVIRKVQWDECELRVVESTTRLLDLLDRHKARATFFVLGWIAERVPALIREIEARNHEIAVHGYNHLLLTQVAPGEFEHDLHRALETIRRSGIQQQVVGFRAPSFTIVEKTMWALEILERNHIKYDSSVFPIGFHPDYGIADAPLRPYKITEQLYEVPLGCVEILGRRVPCSGGGYFRFYPYWLTKRMIMLSNARGASVVFYLHPWELDPGQPRMKIPLMKSIRHYYGLAKTGKKLEKLLNDFQFSTIKEVLGL